MDETMPSLSTAPERNEIMTYMLGGARYESLLYDTYQTSLLQNRLS